MFLSVYSILSTIFSLSAQICWPLYLRLKLLHLIAQHGPCPKSSPLDAMLPGVQFNEIESPLNALILYAYGSVALLPSLKITIISVPKQSHRLLQHLCRQSRVQHTSCLPLRLRLAVRSDPLTLLASKFQNVW